MAVFRPASGGWYVAGQASVFFGRSGDIPVPGNYDADPEVELAVFRPGSVGWYTDMPVPADYTGLLLGGCGRLHR